MNKETRCRLKLAGLSLLLASWGGAAGLDAPANVPGVPIPNEAPSAPKPQPSPIQHFRSARWECHDGHMAATIGPRCLTLQEWGRMADKDCNKRCTKVMTPTGPIVKCGVNRFETGPLCP